MKKRLIAIAFAFIFAFMSIGSLTLVSTIYIGSDVAVVEASLTTSEIKTLQTKLKNWGYYTGSVDGIFGSKTLAAVKLFQEKNGLTVDGIVGSQTAAALGMTLSSSSSSSSSTTVSTSLTTSQIKTVQTKLKNWGYYTGEVDGIYGSLTVAAVKLFQEKNGLTVDGIVGTNTAAALGMTLTTSSDDVSVSSSDLELLARCVYAEARGEIYTGQVAVAAVVLNRVKSSSFPNTIAGVIYQPYAFSCVTDGQINLEPDETAYSAAQDALNGWDPTYGALYYYNASTATSSWIYTRTTTVTIGNHVFAI